MRHQFPLILVFAVYMELKILFWVLVRVVYVKTLENQTGIRLYGVV